jgi:hypothetical protein
VAGVSSPNLARGAFLTDRDLNTDTGCISHAFLFSYEAKMRDLIAPSHCATHNYSNVALFAAHLAGRAIAV